MEDGLSNLAVEYINNCRKVVQTGFAQPCFLCGARCPDGPLCPACSADLPVLQGAACPACGQPTPGGAVWCGRCLKRQPAFDRTLAAYAYAFPLSVLVGQLKYGGELALAAWLGDRLAERVAGGDRPDHIVPVPLHPNRLKTRGFNQSVLIAKRLSRRLALPIDVSACSRVKDTPPQVELPMRSRRGNMRNAFRCDRGLAGRHVALVDDVMTSGASLDALARVGALLSRDGLVADPELH